MKQFILNDEPDKKGQVHLKGNDYRYLVQVRRLAPGECFPALLPNGSNALVKVLSVNKQELKGEISSVSKKKPQALPPIILFQSLPKSDKMDIIVRQAAEGGLSEIVPFISEFSSVKHGSTNKFSRWERIIKEARQQSGSSIETKIYKFMNMDEIFEYWNQIKAKQPGTLGLLFHQIPLEKSSLHGYLNDMPKKVVLAIGPEGGFSQDETERFLAAGFKPLLIGDTVLRTETAAVYAQASVKILLLEKDTWKTA